MSQKYPGGLITKTPVVPSGPYETSTASGIWTLDQQLQYAKQGIWPTAGRQVPDPQFNYVTLLLHGDGTNGAQNNTFLDSSTNNFTITRNGNTTQGSFSPYGNNWSNYFDGTGDRLSIASASALNIGSADMTMEFWMLIPSAFASDYRVVFAKGNNASGGNSYAFEGMASGALTLWVNTDGSSGWNLLSGATIGTPTVGAWNHVVVCRSGTTWYSFMNGTRVLNTTGAGTVTASSTAVTIGDFSTGGFEYTGYVSNLRLVNGTAVYANATTCAVPTTPLTAVTNTALLTCQSNRFLDNSTNNFTITTTGTPSVQRFNPFGASTAYSTSVIGGSGYFDGSGDYLLTPSSSEFNFGTGSFTIEAWVYINSASTYAVVVGGNGSAPQWFVEYSSNRGFIVFNGAADLTTSVTTPLTGQWVHLAVVRNGSTSVVMYQNGVSVGTASSAQFASTFALGIGAYSGGSSFLNGYISNLRIVKGTAVYTAAFTPPTAPLTAVSGTSLLTNMTNGAIFDNAMMNDLETVGNAQISTSVVKYGTGSIKCTGDGNTTTTNSGYLLPNSSSSNLSAFGTGDFTIEFFLYLNSISGLRILLDFRGSTETAFPVLYIGSGGILSYYVESDRINGSSLSTSIWYHIALSRSGTNTKLFVNGTQSGPTYTDSTNYANASTRTPVIGANSYTGGGNVIGWYALDGYIDDLRITKGYARYTATFTPPTAAFPNIGPT